MNKTIGDLDVGYARKRPPESIMLKTEGWVDSSLKSAGGGNRRIGEQVATAGNLSAFIDKGRQQQKNNLLTHSHIESLLRSNYEERRSKIKLHVASFGNLIQIKKKLPNVADSAARQRHQKVEDFGSKVRHSINNTALNYRSPTNNYGNSPDKNSDFASANFNLVARQDKTSSDARTGIRFVHKSLDLNRQSSLY